MVSLEILLKMLTSMIEKIKINLKYFLNQRILIQRNWNNRMNYFIKSHLFFRSPYNSNIKKNGPQKNERNLKISMEVFDLIKMPRKNPFFSSKTIWTSKIIQKLIPQNNLDLKKNQNKIKITLVLKHPIKNQNHNREVKMINLNVVPLKIY